jgi:hypothetical protein
LDSTRPGGGTWENAAEAAACQAASRAGGENPKFEARNTKQILNGKMGEMVSVVMPHSWHPKTMKMVREAAIMPGNRSRRLPRAWA